MKKIKDLTTEEIKLNINFYMGMGTLPTEYAFATMRVCIDKKTRLITEEIYNELVIELRNRKLEELGI